MKLEPKSTFRGLETKAAGDENDNPLAALEGAFEAHDRATKARLDDMEKKLLDEQNRSDQFEAAMKRAPVGEGQKRNEPTIEQKAFDKYIRLGADPLPEIERKALMVGDNPSGGYLASAEYEHEILKNLVLISPVRQVATVRPMSAGEIFIPKRTGAPTARWVGETETRTGTQPAYGQAKISAHEAACYVDISQKLLEDAAIDVAAELGGDLAEEFARLEGEAFLTGDGINKPFGLLNDAGVTQVNSGAATAVTADSLISVFYSLAAWYRNRPSSVWLMNGSSLAACRKLKDGNGQYLWQPGLAPGQPESLLGVRVVEMPGMPDIAAGATPIAVGDLSQYRVYDRVGAGGTVQILRDPYSLATTGQVRFHARRRVGGDLVKAEAIRKVKIAA